ncbi:hypothetical protein D3C73_1308640 [compost metagenome]
MKEPIEPEALLREYFNAPVVMPPDLVSRTLLNIREHNPVGALIGAGALNLVIVLLLVYFLLAGPLFLLWKVIILMVFALFQTIAAAMLVFIIFRRGAEYPEGVI